MSSKDELDDDYVAKLLAEDAKKTSARYLQQGLSALLPKARSADAPRPNTRFLSHIVREADQHNAALKKKEELEARARLNDLRRSHHDDKRVRRADESHSRKRQRLLDDLAGAARSSGGKEPRSRDRPSKRSSKLAKDEHERHQHKRHRSRSRSPARKQELVPHLSNSTDSDKVQDRSARERRRSSASNSDPLEDYVKFAGKSPTSGPTRGRGARNGASSMDKHFAKDYDPSTDVQPDVDDVEGDDWDMALEALRDRMKWKQNQKSRLREAGFDDKQISRWEKGQSDDLAHHADIKDVTWSQRGQQREWDIGKPAG